jgi:hypothetical protein
MTAADDHAERVVELRDRAATLGLTLVEAAPGMYAIERRDGGGSSFCTNDLDGIEQMLVWLAAL